MKIRKCFVANSSGCSFVAMGYIFDEKDFLKNIIDNFPINIWTDFFEKDFNDITMDEFYSSFREVYYENEDNFPFDIMFSRDYNNIPKNKVMVGKLLLCNEDYDINGLIDINDLIENINKKIGVDVKDKNIKFITGNKMC